eukprot:RCo022392
MDFLLDGQPHQVKEGSGERASFFDSPDPNYMWNFPGALGKFEHASAPQETGGLLDQASSAVRQPPQAPVLSPSPGNFERAAKLTISCPSPDVQLFYTLDGSDPVPSGDTTATFAVPFLLPAPSTTVVKAVAEGPDLQLSSVTVGIYVIGSTSSPLASSGLPAADPSAPTASHRPDSTVPEPKPAPLVITAGPGNGRFESSIAASTGGPLPLGPLRYDTPPPSGLTCEAVFRAYHAQKNVLEVDWECLATVIHNKLGEEAVQALMARCQLSQDEGFAIAWYASDLCMVDDSLEGANVWRVANELLRKRAMAEFRQLGLVPWGYWLLKGLQKLPVWAGKAYRGLSVPLLEISTSYVPKKDVTWTAFTSTTVDREGTMRKFATGGASGGTFLQLELTEARDISAFSAFPEQERLLLPNATFAVVQALPYEQALEFFALAGVSVGDFPAHTDMIMLRQVETPAVGKFLLPKA